MTPPDRPRRALVTGADAGIGAAIADALVDAGHDLALHHLGAGQGAAQVASRAAAAGRRATVHEADFADPHAVERLAAAALAEEPVDVLVSNVAVQVMQDWAAVDADAADLQWRVNLRAPLALMQRLVPEMARRGWGRVILVGSVQQVRPHPQMIIYAGLKSAQENMVRNLARQVAREGVTVNAVAPGVIETDRTRAALSDPAELAAVRAQIPMGRIGEPADVAGLVAFLASDAARYLTGQSILVDGGIST